jgi:hypothetical protein
VGTPDGGFIQAPEQRRRVFQDLTATAVVPQGGFLLLGPAKMVYERPCLARPFFLELESNADGQPEWRESIYVISPIVRSIQETQTGRDAEPGAEAAARTEPTRTPP